MERLNEKLWAVAKEYTRQVGELMGCSEWHWIGTDEGVTAIDDEGGESHLARMVLSVCDFGGSWFFSLEDMQVIIDRLDDWVKRYGSKDAVAEEIMDWFYWWIDDVGKEDKGLLDLSENRRERALRTYPRINLEHWLMGCPREPRKPTIDDELRLLVCQCDMVKELIGKYRENRTLGNVLENLNAEMKSKAAIKEKRDAKLFEDMKQTDSYRDFEQAIREHSERGGEF